MKVGILLGSGGMGGAERQAMALAEGMRDRLHWDVEVAWLGCDAGVAGSCSAAGIRYRSLARPESRLPALSAAKIIAIAGRIGFAWRDRTILAFTAPACAVAGFAGRLFGLPVVWCQRDAGLARPDPILERAVARGCRAAVANGPLADAFLRGVPELAARRCGPVPNACLPRLMSHDRGWWRERLGIPPGARLVLMLGTLSHAKDHVTLLRAWAEVEPARPDAWLVLAGRRADASGDIMKLIAEQGLQRVVQAGEVEDVGGILDASDLHVLATRSEGDPNALLEAADAGLPCIATDGAWGEGLPVPVARVPRGAHRDLASAMMAMIDAPRHAKGLVAARRPVAAMVDAYAAIVAEVAIR